MDLYSNLVEKPNSAWSLVSSIGDSLTADAVRPPGRCGRCSARMASINARSRRRRPNTRTGHGAGVQRCRHRRGRPPRCGTADHREQPGRPCADLNAELSTFIGTMPAGRLLRCRIHLLHRRPRLGPSGDGPRPAGLPEHLAAAQQVACEPGGSPSCVRAACSHTIDLAGKPAARRPYRTETAVSCV